MALLFIQVLALCQQAGLVKLGHVVFLLLGLAESAAMPASMAITTDLGRIYGYGTLIGVTNSIPREVSAWSSGCLSAPWAAAW